MVSVEALASPAAPAHMSTLRQRGPIVWVPTIDGWLTTTRDAAVQVLRDDTTFTVDDPRFSTAVVVGESMLSTDGDEHQRHRSPFTAGFTSGQATGFTDRLDELAGALVAELRPHGEAELRTELAGPLAVQVIAEVMDLAGASPEDLLGWYRSIVDGVNDVSAGRSVSATTRGAIGDLGDAVAATIDGGSSLLSGPAAALSADEVRSNTAVLLFGAIETSEGMTANALWHLLSEPGLRDALTAQPDLVSQFVEESLRLEPAAAVVDRYATTSIEFDGVTIAAGDFVRVSLAAANRDPAHFPSPDTFDLDRANAHRHLAFVLGPHACLGLHLARAQTAAALHHVLNALPDIELDAARSSAPAGLIFRKADRLTARW